MSKKILLERLASSVGEVRTQVDIVGLQQFSTDDLTVRGDRFLAQLSEREQLPLDRRDWQTRDDHSVLQLHSGARAVLYHASGAMKYTSGLTPMASLFEGMPDKQRLTSLLEEDAKRLAIYSWAGTAGQIAFERLWQMKAQGADRSGKLSEPVLTRVVGAYRHFIDGVPVLGPASVALKLAGNGALDTLAVHVRSNAATMIEKAVRTLNPELAAIQVNAQLSARLNCPIDAVPTDLIESQTMQFGYFDLGKRKSQRVLAPAFLAQVVIRHKEERQAYMFAVSATEKSYLPFCQCGTEALSTPTRATLPLRTTR
jgi:hypothetical protein